MRRFVFLIVLACGAGLACTSGQPEPATRAAEHAGAGGAAAGRVGPPPPHQDEAEPHEKLPTKIRLSPEVIRAAGIETAPAALDDVPVAVDLTGEIAADPDRSARLAARVPGRIIDVRAKEGDRVKAGQIIATLESPDLARARAALASAVARARAARLNADRLRNLESKGLSSGQELSAATAEAAALEAEEAAARQTLTAFGQRAEPARGGTARVTIRSPLGGFVLSRDGVQGQTVDAAHVIAVIGDLDRAYFLGRLFEKDLARVRVGAAADVRLNAYPGEVFAGQIETIGRQLDPAARTVTARIVVRNHGDMVKVGLFGTARVVVGDAPDGGAQRVVVPLGAVVRVADRDVVFVRQPDGDFEVHHVTTGRAAGGRIEVLVGLRPGEAVVVKGAFTLKSAVLKSTFGTEE